MLLTSRNILLLLAMSLLLSNIRAFAKFRALPSVGGLHRSARLLSIQGGASSEGLPADEAQRPFYALGVNIARQVGSDVKPLLSSEEVKHFLQGFSDSINNRVDDELALLDKHGQKLNDILTSRVAEVKKGQNEKAAFVIEGFMKNNPQAYKTASGLIFCETVAATGPQPAGNSTVEVHYHGTLLDGTVFDSSVVRGTPARFPLDRVIKGWQEGVALMKEGSKATLIIPPDLAYGDRGAPPSIPGGATLRFEVELLKVF